jgi:hypothetical protein
VGRGSSIPFISFRNNKNDVSGRKKLSVAKFQKVSKLDQNKVSSKNINENESSPLVKPTDRLRSDILTNKIQRYDENHG